MLGNAGKHVIISSFQSINFTWATSMHTLVLTREWIAMLTKTVLLYLIYKRWNGPMLAGSDI